MHRCFFKGSDAISSYVFICECHYLYSFEIVILLLKSRINKNREPKNTMKLEMKGMLSDQCEL